MNRFKTLLFASALALSCVAPSAMAQTEENPAPTVEIGGTTLDLGAPRADALAVANAQFELTPTARPNEYTLYPKRDPEEGWGPPYPKAFGTITLKDNRLARVTRYLGSFKSADAEEAVENMIAAFSDAPKGGNTPSVHTDSGLDGEASTSRVYFSYPDRAIQIVVYRANDSDGLATIDVTEQYALPGDTTPTMAIPQ